MSDPKDIVPKMMSNLETLVFKRAGGIAKPIVIEVSEKKFADGKLVDLLESIASALTKILKEEFEEERKKNKKATFRGAIPPSLLRFLCTSTPLSTIAEYIDKDISCLRQDTPIVAIKDNLDDILVIVQTNLPYEEQLELESIIEKHLGKEYQRSSPYVNAVPDYGGLQNAPPTLPPITYSPPLTEDQITADYWTGRMLSAAVAAQHVDTPKAAEPDGVSSEQAGSSVSSRTEIRYSFVELWYDEKMLHGGPKWDSALMESCKTGLQAPSTAFVECLYQMPDHIFYSKDLFPLVRASWESEFERGSLVDWICDLCRRWDFNVMYVKVVLDYLESSGWSYCKEEKEAYVQRASDTGCGPLFQPLIHVFVDLQKLVKRKGKVLGYDSERMQDGGATAEHYWRGQDDHDGSLSGEGKDKNEATHGGGGGGAGIALENAAAVEMVNGEGEEEEEEQGTVEEGAVGSRSLARQKKFFNMAKQCMERVAEMIYREITNKHCTDDIHLRNLLSCSFHHDSRCVVRLFWGSVYRATRWSNNGVFAALTGCLWTSQFFRVQVVRRRCALDKFL